MKKILTGFLCIMILLTSLFIPNVHAKSEVIDGEYVVKQTTNGKSDIKKSLNPGEIDVAKSSTYLKEGTFRIDLTTNGKPFEIVSEGEINLVFVLDNSISMYTETDQPTPRPYSLRIKKLIDALNITIEELWEYDNINVSVVLYSTRADTIMTFDQYNTYKSQYPKYSDLLTYLQGKDASAGSNGKYAPGLFSCSYKSSASSQVAYCGASNLESKIQAIPITTSHNGSIINTIGNVEINYGDRTNIQAGSLLGYDQLNSASNKSKAVPAMILMTDGEPNVFYSTNGTETKEAARLLTTYSSTHNIYEGTTRDTLPGFATILQLNYIKQRMKNINSNAMIYNIFFDPGLRSNAVANAHGKVTMNPTNANINTSHSVFTETETDKSIKTLLETYGQTLWTNSGFSSSSYPEINSLTYSERIIESFSTGTTAPIGNAFKEILNSLITTDSFKPIKSDTYLILTDKINNNFVYSGNLVINNKNYELTNNTITSSEGIIVTLAGNNLEAKVPVSISDNKNEISFDVKLTSREVEVVYPTNDELTYEFIPHLKNPKYENNQKEIIDVTGTIILSKEIVIDVPDTGTFIWIGSIIGGLGLIAGGYFFIYKKKRNVIAE